MYSGRVSNEENDKNDDTGVNEDNVDKRPQKFATFLTIKKNNHNFHSSIKSDIRNS